MHLNRALCSGLAAVVADGTVSWISSPDIAARSIAGVEDEVGASGGGGGGGISGEAVRCNSAGGGSSSSSDSSGE